MSHLQCLHSIVYVVMEGPFLCFLGKNSSTFSTVALKLLCLSPENAFHIEFVPLNNTFFILSKSHTICFVVQFLLSCVCLITIHLKLVLYLQHNCLWYFRCYCTFPFNIIANGIRQQFNFNKFSLE